MENNNENQKLIREEWICSLVKVIIKRLEVNIVEKILKKLKVKIIKLLEE